MTRGLVASPLGLLVGLVLGSLGSGGSILAVPMLVLAAGQTAQDATAASLLLVGTAAVAGLRRHLRAGRVRVAMGVGFGLSGFGGSLAGTALNRRLDPDVLLLAFSGLIIIAAWRMVTACPTCTRVGEERVIEGRTDAVPRRLDAARVLVVLVVGTGVGFLTGLFGVGGGFVIVPALTLVLGFAMPQAIGTSLLVVAINSAMALFARIGSAHVDWTIALAFTVAAVVGVQIGSHLADRLDPERSLRAFAAALVLLAVYTGGRAIVALAPGDAHPHRPGARVHDAARLRATRSLLATAHARTLPRPRSATPPRLLVRGRRAQDKIREGDVLPRSRQLPPSPASHHGP